MSGADDDTELRDLLIQTLDTNGVLGKIKAELRASVFLAIDCLEAQDQSKNKSPLTNTKLQKFVSENDGQLCLDLILEFMQHFNLDYSSAVFVPETNTAGVFKARDQLREKLNLKDSEAPSNLPLLACCLKSKPSNNVSMRSTLSKKQLDKAKELFSRSDRAQINAVSCPDAVKILSFLCPTFPVFLVDKFVSEEMSTSSSTKITWNNFQCLYEKFYTACHSVVTNQDELETSQFSSCQTPYTKTSSFNDLPSNDLKSSNETTKRSIDDVFASSVSPSHIPKPVSTAKENSDMDVDFNKFYEDVLKSDDFTSPSKIPPPSRSKLPRLEHKPSKLPPPTASDAWSAKEDLKKNDDSEKQSMDYDDDFNSNTENTEASISEDIQADSYLSSTPSSLAELTEDHSLSQKATGHADYMEDANSFNLT